MLQLRTTYWGTQRLIEGVSNGATSYRSGFLWRRLAETASRKDQTEIAAAACRQTETP